MKKVYFFIILLATALIVLIILNMKEETNQPVTRPTNSESLFALRLQAVDDTLGRKTGLRLFIKNISEKDQIFTKGELGKGPDLLLKDRGGKIIESQNDLASMRYDQNNEALKHITLKPEEETILEESFATKDSPESGQSTLNWGINYFKNLKFGVYRAEASWDFDGKIIRSNEIDFIYKN